MSNMANYHPTSVRDELIYFLVNKQVYKHIRRGGILN